VSTARPSPPGHPSPPDTSHARARDWVAIQHVPYETPGLIAAEAARHGIDLSVCRTYRGDPLPTLDTLVGIDGHGELGGLVVMGGPMGVGEVSEHPYLAGELELLAAAVAAGLPVLGVCLGAQLLAAALGARVYRGERPEIGSGSVSLTAEGRADPVLGAAGLAELPVVHWHEDTFDLPPGAVLLAGSALYPHQAFRVGPGTGTGMGMEMGPGTGTRTGTGTGTGRGMGPATGTGRWMGTDADTGAMDAVTRARTHARVYGLQFHVEVDRALAADWRPRLPEGAVIDESARAEVERVGRTVIAAFFAEQIP